ncbi:hypothetical protein KSS87_017704 [Heliosperma pusillum]|nr:hypothetical protein KSS87_017704 [Heliosperma pusillum]
MAAKHKSLTSPLFRALSQTPSISVEKFEITASHGHPPGPCDMCGCGIYEEPSDALQLDLGLSGLSEVGPSRVIEEIEGDELRDGDWSDLTESQLEELVLSFISSWKNSLAGAVNSHSQRCLIHTTGTKEADISTTPDSVAFVKDILDADGRNNPGIPQPQYNPEKSDIVHIKLIKNNTFVTVTDSKGNKKIGASSGCLEEMKAGPKVSRYAAEATAEHVGRLARNLGLKSVVMRVNGFTHFKKKKQAILSWKEGYTLGRGDRNPINYIEDTTRRPHNGCRLPKKRRY